MKTKSILIAMILVSTALTAPIALARVSLVTLPARDSVQLTIYNAEDITMVREKRFLTFKKGVNNLEFSWANTLIDPTSVEFRAITHADKIEVLDVSFPPRVTNTLEWHIASEADGEVQVEIQYFTSGISWAADYVGMANGDQTMMDLGGYVRVNNNSGEDYDNAQVRLVVGVIRLVEKIRDLAQQPPVVRAEEFAKRRVRLAGAVERAERKKDLLEAAPEIIKEGISEYFIYTVEGRDDVKTGWSKRLSSFTAKDVPVTAYYRYDERRWAQNAMRYYKFKNNEDSQLGNEPLPDGGVRIFRTKDAEGLLSYVGQTRVKYIPINEDVEMELGYDPQVRVEGKLMDWRKDRIHFGHKGNVDGYDQHETWTFEIQNSKNIPIEVDVRRHFRGDWGMKTDDEYEKIDANTVKFVRKLNPMEQVSFTYTVTTCTGANERK